MQTYSVPGRTLALEVRTCHSSTAGAVWESARVLGALLAEELRARDHTVLELGAGTGFLAMMMASGAKGTRVIATDTMEHLRNLKYNVNKNNLRHAVSCLAWDWRQPPPEQLDWSAITLCVASDVTYYAESPRQEAALVAGLRSIVGCCRADARILLLLRVRLDIRTEAAAGESTSSERFVPVASDEACASATLRFIAHALPVAGLHGAPLPIPDALAGDGSFRYFEVRSASPEALAALVAAAAAATSSATSASVAPGGVPAVEADGAELVTADGDGIYCAPLEDLMSWSE